MARLSRTPIYTTAQVAHFLGLQPKSVRDLARRRGVGTHITSRMTLYSEADIEQLKHRDPRGRKRPARGPSPAGETDV